MKNKLIKRYEQFIKTNENATTKPITKPDIKPKVNPLTPNKPLVSPQPKNYEELLKKIIMRYNQLTKPTTKPDIDIKPKINPLTPNKPLVSPQPKNYVNTYEQFELDKGDYTPDTNLNMGRLMSDFQDIMNIERRLNKNDLYRLAKDVIKYEFFGESKFIDFEDIKWDLEIVDMSEISSKIGKFGFDRNESYNYDDEVTKREIINMITQGQSTKSQEYLYDFTDNNDISNYNVPSSLINKYFNFMSDALKTHHTVPFNVLKSQPATGVSYVKWDGETPIIVAKGVNFIILLHEMIKGVNELFSYHGLPNDEETIKHVDRKTSTWYHESEGLKWGKLIIERFDAFFNDLENQLLRNGDISSKNKEMKIILLTNFYTLEAKTFIKYCEALFNNKGEKPYDYFKDIYLNYIESEDVNIENDNIMNNDNIVNNDNDNDIVEIDYSKLSKKQLDDELNHAIDNNDIKKIEIISKYLKENYKFKHRFNKKF